MALDVEGNEQDAMAMAEMFETIDTCPVPVVARVQGAALGGGMGLCAVADVVIAEAGTKFGFTETRLGILPAVISPFVIAKIGESHARALFPGGRRFDAFRAQRIGLVHEVVEGEEALDEAVAATVADVLGVRPDGGACREGDRPRGARAGPRGVEVAHGEGDRAAARRRGGPGGLPGVHARSGRRPGSPTRSGSRLDARGRRADRGSRLRQGPRGAPPRGTGSRGATGAARPRSCRPPQARRSS